MTAIAAAVIGVASALLGVVVGKVWDNRSEERRWVRDIRLKRIDSALINIDDMRDYATRLTQSNERRSLDEKEEDVKRFGQKQRVVLNECTALRLVGTPELRHAADELASFIRTTLFDWVLEAKRNAEQGKPFSEDQTSLRRLSELVGTLEQSARRSITQAGLRRTISD